VTAATFLTDSFFIEAFLDYSLIGLARDFAADGFLDT
jgi:hypothetical protein